MHKTYLVPVSLIQCSRIRLSSCVISVWQAHIILQVCRNYLRCYGSAYPTHYTLTHARKKTENWISLQKLLECGLATGRCDALQIVCVCVHYAFICCSPCSTIHPLYIQYFWVEFFYLREACSTWHSAWKCRDAIARRSAILPPLTLPRKCIMLIILFVYLMPAHKCVR